MVLLITGASGFVGRSFCRVANDQKLSLRALTNSPKLSTPFVEYSAYPCSDSGWNFILENVDCVIHLAGRAHILSDKSSNPLREYRAANVFNSVDIAQHSIRAGVKRFVYISSIKVNGEFTVDAPFRSADMPSPHDAYALSKLEAESELKRIFENTSSELVIVRPPLIHGPCVKGNLALIYKFARFGLPLPLSSFSGNQRSILFVDNLIDFLILCSYHQKAAGQTFLIDDGYPLSTRQIIGYIYDSIDRPLRDIPLPSKFIEFVLGLFGKKEVYSRLRQSLLVDSTPAFNLLNWDPPYSSEAGFMASPNFIS